MEGLYGETTDPNAEVKLTMEQKQAIMEMISNFNEYGKCLSRDRKLGEIAGKISEIAKHADTFMMNETGDWFDKQTVSKNSKEMKKCADDFCKIAQEASLLEQRMSASYEDMGHFLSRYFDIKEITESVHIQKQPTTSTAPSMAPSDITPAS